MQQIKTNTGYVLPQNIKHVHIDIYYYLQKYVRLFLIFNTSVYWYTLFFKFPITTTLTLKPSPPPPPPTQTHILLIHNCV